MVSTPDARDAKQTGARVLCGGHVLFMTIFLAATGGARAAGAATIRGFGVGHAAVGVSADGSVVAGWRGSVIDGSTEATRWAPSGSPQGLGFLPGDTASRGTAVSGDGLVVVGGSFTPFVGGEAFRWTEGTGMQPLGALPAGLVGSGARAVNADGSVIVGDSSQSAGGRPRAWRWTQAGGVQALEDLPGGRTESIPWGGEPGRVRRRRLQ